MAQNIDNLFSNEFIEAIVNKESSGNAEAIGDDGEAVGILQIHKDYVDDVNNFLETNKSDRRYSYDDRKNPEKSIEIFKIYMSRYATEERLGHKATLEDISRIHNGGPNGYKKDATVGYWNDLNNNFLPKHIGVRTPKDIEIDCYANLKYNEPFDPSEAPDINGHGVEYPLAETLFFRPALAFVEAVVPGARRGLTEFAFIAGSHEDVELMRKEANEWADSIDRKELHKKLPEIAGWTAEKLTEYFILKGAFKFTKAGVILDKLGLNVANKVMPEAIQAANVSSLTTKEGLKTITRRTLASAIKSAPKTTQFMGVWGGLSSVKQGNKFSDGYIDGVEWGLLLSTAVPVVLESSKAAMSTRMFEKVITRFDGMFPSLARKVKGTPSVASQRAVLSEIKEAGIAAGKDVPADLNITHLGKTARGVIESLARRRDALLKKSEMAMYIRKGVESKAAMATAAEATAAEATGTPANIYERMPIERVQADAKNGVQAAKDAIAKMSLGGKVTAIESVEAIKKRMGIKRREVIRQFKKMRLSENDANLIARAVTGKSSTKDMSYDELNKVIGAINSTDVSENAFNRLQEKKTETIGKAVKVDNSMNSRRIKEKAVQIKRMQDIKNKADKSGGKYGYINHYNPSRIAIGDFEYDTGINISYPSHEVTVKSKHAKAKAEEVLPSILTEGKAKTIQDAKKQMIDLARTITPEENARIAKWLFSEESRKGVGVLTDKEKYIAEKLNWFAQEGPMAPEKMEEAFRKWLDYKQPPSDVGQFTDAQIKALLKGAKISRNKGELKQFTKGLFDKNIRFGLQKGFYYPSEGEGTMMVMPEGMSMSTGEPFLEETEPKYKGPALTGYDTLPKRTKGNPKPGSVIHNFQDAFVRVSVRNAVAEDIKGIVKEINDSGIKLNIDDKAYLDSWFNKIMGRADYTPKGLKPFTALNRVFWRHHLSFLSNPKVVLLATRNALQIVSQLGQSVNIKNFIKHAAKLPFIKDAEMEEDFKNKFNPYVDQRRDIYSTVAFKDITNKALADNIPKKFVDSYVSMLDKTGWMYLLPDWGERILTWETTYQSTKEAANQYLQGQINYDKFMQLTHADTGMTKAGKDNVDNLLKSGNVRELSNYIAENVTFDTYREYSETGRAGVERTTSSRLIWAVYPYWKGWTDLFYRKGIKNSFQAIKTGNKGMLKRSCMSVAKGIFGSYVADRILKKTTGKSAYGWSAVVYRGISPGISIPVETIGRISTALWRFDKKQASVSETRKAISNAIYYGLEQFTKYPTWKEIFYGEEEVEKETPDTRTRDSRGSR